jgi:hypothetical protein
MHPTLRNASLLAASLVIAGCAATAASAPTTGATPARTNPAATPTTTTPPTGGTQGGAPSGAPAGGTQGAGQGGGGTPAAPRPYRQVVTERAVTQTGLFKVHRIGERMLFEIPATALNKEMLVTGRLVENTQQALDGFFGGGPNQVVEWSRTGNRVVLRDRDFRLYSSDTTQAIQRRIDTFRRGAVYASWDVQAYGPDSAAVIDATDLFLSNIPEFAPIAGLVRNRSWIEQTWAFPRNVNIEVTQTGAAPNAPPPGLGGAGGGGPAQTQTRRTHFSMVLLPEAPMMPRFEDDRVGFISHSFYDLARNEHKARLLNVIHRFKLVKKDPAAAVSDPVEPIIYWIDPATPDWLKPYVVAGVNQWQPAFREAGFSNAIFGRVAPTPQQDSTFSLYDARNSVIYWWPSTVANATGGQTVDPRTGEIIKGEVNMFHNIMELQKNWYFTQVSPLDARARSLPMPDSLMGKLVEYVVAHEIGHSIGFPHNMKASAQYPVDSIRNRGFLERMNGHVATLMDYSRFNYVAQPEDSIPPHLLIPQVGPYDKFAVKWGYAPIPGARTPDEERPVLDQWARQQDQFPWLRFTTSDATADHENLTEAVGDADAVRSTTLAMRNLTRVVGSLQQVAEKPMENYDELQTLYNSALGQWGTYMNHVAAIVGAAYTQEKYGTGERYRPVEKARMREAVRYLNATSFQVPQMFLDPAILRRIENEGVVERIRARQAAVVNSLLGVARMNRLVEFESMAARPSDSYTLADLMEDMRAGIWGELNAPSVRVNVYRRNLQRAFLNTANSRLNPPPLPAGAPAALVAAAAASNPANSDIRGVIRAELQDLDRAIAAALPRAGDAMTRIHLRDLRTEIAKILDPGNP